MNPKRISEVLTGLLTDEGVRRRALRKVEGSLRFELAHPSLAGPTYTSFVPDSVWSSKAHPEVDDLLPQWLEQNAFNNGGDLPRFLALVLNVKQILKEKVPGDFAELGVFRGNSAALLAHFAARESRRVFLFDTFEGFDARDRVGGDAQFGNQFNDVTLEGVKKTVGNAAVCHYRPGYFPDSIDDAVRDAHYAIVHLDCDLYKPMKAGLEFFWPRLSPGGLMLLHDYGSGLWEGSTQAIDEFVAETGETVTLLPDKSGTAMIRKRRSAPR
jgi:hypothetical protein